MERMYGKEWAQSKQSENQTPTNNRGMERYMETEMVNLPTVESFKYLGSTIDRGGGASKAMENRVTKA